MSMSNDEVASRFVEKGESLTGSNMFSEGDTIYSYGHHFPIARKLPNGDFLFNTKSYSMTTTRHKSLIKRYIHTNIWKCPNCDINTVHDYYRIEIDNTVDKMKRAQTKLPHYIKKATDLIEEYKAFCKRFKLYEHKRISNMMGLPYIKKMAKKGDPVYEELLSKIVSYGFID